PPLPRGRAARSRADQAGSDQPDRQRARSVRPRGRDRRSPRGRPAGRDDRGRGHGPGHPAARPRKALPARLHDEGSGDRARPRDRFPPRRRSQRHDPRRRQPPEGRAVHHRAAGGVKKRRVLVIDDEKAIRETLSEILSDEGYTVTAVESGDDGLRRFLDEKFDLVFLDVWLRDRDGLSLLEAANGRLSEVPVVMISGRANVETAVRAVRLGAYDFLEKPLSLDRVVLTAQKAIE